MISFCQFLNCSYQRLEEENEALLRAKVALEDVANTLVPKLQKKIEKYKQQLVDLTTR